MSRSDASSPVVLVVDDEAIVRLEAVAFLEDAGFTVIDAPDGATALAALAAHPEISVVFTDVTMPGGVDGVELARRVNRRRPDISLIVTSGRPPPAHAALPPGARFVPKPYDSRLVTGLV